MMINLAIAPAPALPAATQRYRTKSNSAENRTIIARAPLRVSFGGGGTDLAAYYRCFGGLVISVSIDQFVWALVDASAGGVEITAHDGGTVVHYSSASGQLPADALRLPLAVIERCAPGANLRILLSGDLPSGRGLGSSSATAVALIEALSAYTGMARTPAATAALASTIEIDDLGSPIGKQDQYASALGGLNVLTFEPDGAVGIEPLAPRPEVLNALQQRLLLFYAGARRNGASILAHQTRASEERRPQTLEALHAIKALAAHMRDALLEGDLDRFGLLLHASWEQKRRVTAGISTTFIDRCYAAARQAGALGGKITGAGGGGYLLLYCQSERQAAVIAALRPLGLEPLPVRFTTVGAQVLTPDGARLTPQRVACPC